MHPPIPHPPSFMQIIFAAAKRCPHAADIVDFMQDAMYTCYNNFPELDGKPALVMIEANTPTQAQTYFTEIQKWHKKLAKWSSHPSKHSRVPTFKCSAVKPFTMPSKQNTGIVQATGAYLREHPGTDPSKIVDVGYASTEATKKQGTAALSLALQHDMIRFHVGFSSGQAPNPVAKAEAIAKTLDKLFAQLLAFSVVPNASNTNYSLTGKLKGKQDDLTMTMILYWSVVVATTIPRR